MNNLTAQPGMSQRREIRLLPGTPQHRKKNSFNGGFVVPKQKEELKEEGIKTESAAVPIPFSGSLVGRVGRSEPSQGRLSNSVGGMGF